MQEYLSETTAYLKRFFEAKYPEYFEDMKELRPSKGYGHYYRHEDVTQFIRNIVHNITDQFDDLRIPEGYSSPEHLIQTLLDFKQMLESQNVVFADVFAHYHDTSLKPIPVVEIYKANNEVLSAIKHVLTFEENKKYLEQESVEIDNRLPFEKLTKIIKRFHLLATQLLRRRKEGGVPRPTLEIKDEYDVQDLLHSLLIVEFEDIRKEEWIPSYAGGSSRTDFLLKEEKIFIEVKMTRETLKDKHVGDQLIIDKARYNVHQDCEHLVCFVYDPSKFIENPSGLINDLKSENDGDLKVSIFIEP